MRTLSRLTGWATGAPLATFRFLARRVAVNEHGWTPDGESAGAAVGLATSGEAPGGLHGRPVRRLVRGRVERPRIRARQLIDIIAADPNVVMPIEVARFRRTGAPPGDLRPGDELVVRMAGPWDGPVVVVDRAPDRIRFASRPAQGQVGEFELRALASGREIVFEVESRAWSASRWFHLVYRRLTLGERMQLHTWAHVVESAARVAGGRLAGAIDAYSGDCPAGPRAAVLYDSGAAICRLATALTIRLDREGRLWPVAIESDEGAVLLAALGSPEPSQPPRIECPGDPPAPARAVAAIVRRLPGRVLAARPPRPAVERADSVIAGRRCGGRRAVQASSQGPVDFVPPRSTCE